MQRRPRKLTNWTLRRSVPAGLFKCARPDSRPSCLLSVPPVSLGVVSRPVRRIVLIGVRQRRCPDTGYVQRYGPAERGRAMDAVTAAVLTDVAFDAVSEATQFSTQRYREKIEQFRQSGKPTSDRSEVERDGLNGTGSRDDSGRQRRSAN
jgi:hypothetical protein